MLCSAKTPSPFRRRGEQAGNRGEAHSELAWKPPFYPRPKDAASLAWIWAHNLSAQEPRDPKMNAVSFGCNKTPVLRKKWIPCRLNGLGSKVSRDELWRNPQSNLKNLTECAIHQTPKVLNSYGIQFLRSTPMN